MLFQKFLPTYETTSKQIKAFQYDCPHTYTLNVVNVCIEEHCRRFSPGQMFEN